MKITNIRSWHIRIPHEYGAPKPAERPTQDAVYLCVETDAGMVGWGEAFGFGACAITNFALQSTVAPLAIGRDAADIPALMTDLWKQTQGMSRNGPVAYALSGLDIALWDLAGKLANKPLHILLGGAKRHQIPAYASLLRLNTPQLVAMGCKRAMARGYSQIKLHERTVETVAAARETLGAEYDLMLDTNCTWSPRQALDMVEALKNFNLAWLEEPIFPPDDYNALAKLRGRGVAIAAGENVGNIMDLQNMLRLGAVDIAQPDVAKMGGVSAMVEAACLCEAADVELHPHSPLYGPALVATIHLIAAMAGETSCEYYFADLEANPIGDIATPKDGFFTVPDGPGLGVAVDVAMLERYAVR